MHPGGATRWHALITQTAPRWLNYHGIPAERINHPLFVLAGDRNRDRIIPLELSLQLHRHLRPAEIGIAPAPEHEGPFTAERGPSFAAMICDFTIRHAYVARTTNRKETAMFADTKAYSGIGVRDLDQARTFYTDTLGVSTSEEYGLLWLHLAGGRDILVYEAADATPASFTILNFQVDDIDAAVDELTARGVRFLRYDEFPQDDRGIFRDEGPYIAWFADPSGNVLSVLQEK